MPVRIKILVYFYCTLEFDICVSHERNRTIAEVFNSIVSLFKCFKNFDIFELAKTRFDFIFSDIKLTSTAVLVDHRTL